MAGPGSGKTRVLTNRVAYLIQEYGVLPENILCVTFTNKAAGEIKDRVRALLGTDKAPAWTGTFHSVCSKILRKDGFNIGVPVSFAIYDSDDQAALIKSILKDFGIDPKKFSPSNVLATISSAKSELIKPSEYEKLAYGYYQKTVAKIYPEYQKRLRKNVALDFDDLLVETVNLFEQNQQVLEKYQAFFKFILVDEYQDTNKAQYVLAKLLALLKGNLYTVGDMSQAIYSFRGADYRNILHFQQDYPNAKVYNLEQNYRSTQTILDAAKSVIKNNSTHIPLDLWTKNGGGEKIVSFTARSEKEEAQFVVDELLYELSQGKSYEDIAVLYRTNAQSRNMEEALIKNNIPYKIVGGLRFYARKEIKDVIGYLRVLHNPKDSVSWERIINVPNRGLGQKSVEKLKEGGWVLAEIEEKTKLPFAKWLGEKEKLSLRSVAALFVNLEEFLENVSLIESSNRANVHTVGGVTLMTIHASKGLEFPVVFIIGMEEGLFPHIQSIMELAQLEEERRLCYVAITRAMEKVFLTSAQSRLYFGTTQSNMPSRFLAEIPQRLVSQKGLGGNKSFNAGDFLDEMDVKRRNFSW